MRSDMEKLVGKVVKSTQYVRRAGRAPRSVDDYASREPIRSTRCYYSSVNNSDPLVRWLHRQVGKPWSQVYSALSGLFDTRKKLGQDVREYVKDTVRTKVFEQDGALVYYSRWGNKHSVEGELYVDNKGLLQYGTVAKSWAALQRHWRAEATAKKKANCVQISETLQLRKVEGIWYKVTLAPITAPRYIEKKPYVCMDGTKIAFPSELDEESLCKDVLTHQSHYDVPGYYAAKALKEEYGTSAYYASYKQQASKAEIRRYVS